ncbi:SAM-dependent methyltransferase [Bosea sp. 62]|uniref:methyltransferase domain-containing protein n=1 Tax=unclassified Bosea (in: a-proteobacteria) TaxID=2653178 RepID=UPI001251F23F|nr:MULTISPECIES: methyltransferase domain-containing protein [unclassified Bosea (in: a-proteobacteria)]CAD5250773.1 SAM-dependent methyltransferase [Bosea sp. 21B]CAD5263208.1 SAM-dependent methyltransferase [Bosea sp. 7B]CAD5271492.1 SAM-dependent methyltransferase [Bosea sp. 46]VVT43897.1 Methyltransferase domain-containing protein [Bosea sp. EC-HK365B]VXB17604.1 SAM-dependent methyltransferase [Bosea sp. 29B]
MSSVVFDRALYRRRLSAALAAGYPDFLLVRCAADLDERLSAVLRRFERAADLGTPLPLVGPVLQARAGDLLRMAEVAETSATIVGDLEALPFAAESLDLAASLLALHAVNDLPGSLIQIKRALRPDGLFIACLLAGQSLTELRQSLLAAEVELTGGASPRVAPFADLRDLGGLLQRAGFALPVIDSESVTVRYGDMFGLLRDLRAMGWANALTERSRKPLRRAVLLRAAELYAERFADPDGRLRATFEIVWLSGWAPHESQQKPLRPGSAKARLADALGVPEIGAGDKAGGEKP